MTFYFFSMSFLYRAIIAFFLSCMLFLIFGKQLMKWLNRKQMVDHFRAYTPPSHKSKKGTPSGGGLFILFLLVLSFFLLGNITNRYLLLVLLTTLSFGFLGFADDTLKRLRENSKGLSLKTKLSFQILISIVVVGFIYHAIPDISTGVKLPFTAIQIELGILYFPFIAFIIVAFSNAVNFSDGLDGLAAGCMVMPAFFFIAAALIAGNTNLASFFNKLYLPGSGELAFFWFALSGALLGFLRYNRYPASVFMGGVGADALGGALAISGILLKMELLLVFLGVVFVAEAVSVLLQIIAYRLTGKRIFKIAPLHHHFELSGIKEPKIVHAFWMVSLFSSAGAFLSLILVR